MPQSCFAFLVTAPPHRRSDHGAIAPNWPAPLDKRARQT
jgi:hypothetical protein